MKLLGAEHPDTALSYNNLAANLNAQGKYAEAEKHLRKALALEVKLVGKEHPHTATCYNNLALNLNGQGKYAEAEKHLGKALALRLKLLGEEHPHTAASYNNLAVNLKDQRKNAEAEKHLRKALALRLKLLGEEHPDTAQSYDNLAVNLNAQGKYAEAEKHFHKALALRLKLLGEEHRDTALSYNNLAANLDDEGKYAEAETHYRKGLALQVKLLGQEHPDTALSYSNLALNLIAQGKYGEAEKHNRKALTLHLKLLGEKHSRTALSYSNLAFNLNAQGKYAEADTHCRKALTLRVKLLGEEHSDTALSYYNLASHLNFQGNYAEAEGRWLQAARSFSRARPRLSSTGLDRAAKTGERSPFPDLAGILARNGKGAEAWRRFEESLARGTWDDLSSRLLRSPAEQGEQRELVARLHRLDQLVEKTLARKDTPELKKSREDLLTQRRQAQDRLDEFTAAMEKKHGPVAGQVFERAIIQKGLPADVALVAWLDIDGHPKAKDPNGEHWAVLLRSAGEPIWVKLAASSRTDWQSVLPHWTKEDSQLPGRLRAALQNPKAAWQPLAKKLHKQRLEPLQKYLAANNDLPAVKRLIVLPSTIMAGVPVEVFAEGYTVSYALSGTLYAHLRQQPALKSDGLLVLADPVFDRVGQAFQPDTAPLPPGGLLVTQVVPGSNAAGANVKPGDVLLRYAGRELKSGEELSKLIETRAGDKEIALTIWRDGKTGTRLVLPGKLGVVLAKAPAPEAIADRRKAAALLASLRSGDDGKWDELPGTRVEAESLRKRFGDKQTTLLTDSQASEQVLNDLAAKGELGKYRYIHLATHGVVDERRPLSSAVILSRDNLPDPDQQLIKNLPIYDGRLTAEEVLQKWHLNAELVTLSACQTALGKYERGEGFVGFAQALLLAGSRSVCLSLWKVDDTATALLMDRFYENLLKGRASAKRKPGMNKAEALAEAKAWLRNLTQEEAAKRVATLTNGVARGTGRPRLPLLPAVPSSPQPQEIRPYAHPYYWAAFILIGDEQ